LAAQLDGTKNGTRPQPNYGTPRKDEAERMESGSADKEREHPESENEQQESAHDRNAPDDLDGNM
jgi:hypothetical protein